LTDLLSAAQRKLSPVGETRVSSREKASHRFLTGGYFCLAALRSKAVKLLAEQICSKQKIDYIKIKWVRLFLFEDDDSAVTLV
jgi:hypothetical protein